MKATRLAANLYVLPGAVNTGVIVAAGKALLIDCCDTVTPERLSELGVAGVDMILCTQHRRPNVAGACPFVESGARLVVPASERHLFEEVASYWHDETNRWYIYRHQPGPQVLARPLKVDRGVKEREVIAWEAYSIRVLETPGATDGSVSYLVEIDGRSFCFSGDAIYGPGQLWDFYSLQKGYGPMGDYHGFLGNKHKLIPSLEKLRGCGAEVLVPSHGEVIPEPEAAIALLLERLERIWRNYTSISCVNHYFPGAFDETKDDPLRLKPVQTREPPDFVRRVGRAPSFALISETETGKAALLLDCGNKSVVETLQQWLEAGEINAVEGCWITHYHNDHVDALPELVAAFDCPVIADQHLAEIVAHPLRFLLPCISPHATPVTKVSTERESWSWHEFKLTAGHFPGQSLYHGGLLVEGRGTKIFFAGDSGSPTGIDDHTCGNRNFLGAGKGFRRCLDIWRQCQPDYIFNQHQARAFSFTDAELDYMDKMLAEREKLFAETLPWAHPNFGTDEWWVRTYPFEQEAAAGKVVAIDVQFTNHGPQPVEAEVEPVKPDGWDWDQGQSNPRITVPGNTDGSVDEYCANPDKAARVRLAIPTGAAPGRYVIPFRVTWGARYLGQFRHAIVVVREK